MNPMKPAHATDAADTTHGAHATDAADTANTANTANTATITRVDETQWEAVTDSGLIVGEGDLSHRPDGRRFISIDVWQDTVFDQLAAAMLAELPEPLHTLVGEHDHALTSRWERLGFTVGRREHVYVLPTKPPASSAAPASSASSATRKDLPPTGVTIAPAGTADETLLRALDRTVRQEIEATVGWHTMPAEVLSHPDGDTLIDPSKYAAAALNGEYVGLVRVVPVRSRARIGLLAVRADHRGRGIGRALLTHALSTLHRGGIGSAWAEVDTSNAAAIALVEAVGATRSSGYVELVRH
ncbi:GNAT family N-acetyltransferase [Streptomyces beihaiensis]|uniref:GNAT family N-acetyltransferase n=1 Tax=Streptomyces beihaiensis TaxID=2984495 RepID=A0ABT3TQE5_9ACTN|nr:GNAT family N-acetyltransferase [Streptomyces beihaiensis]MCX3059222.1 GNAT family N-acetyltransferase [Streptomyces beihaiensis]